MRLGLSKAGVLKKCHRDEGSWMQLQAYLLTDTNCQAESLFIFWVIYSLGLNWIHVASETACKNWIVNSEYKSKFKIVDCGFLPLFFTVYLSFGNADVVKIITGTSLDC